jgi:hypothetical protein
MPVRSEYHKDLGIWEIHFEGSSDADAAIETLRTVYGAIDPTRPFLLLWQTGVGVGVMDSPDLERLMSFVEDERPDVEGRTAIVAHDEATYGMGRVAQIYGESVVPHLWVFHERDEAINWLMELSEDSSS